MAKRTKKLASENTVNKAVVLDKPQASARIAIGPFKIEGTEIFVSQNAKWFYIVAIVALLVPVIIFEVRPPDAMKSFSEFFGRFWPR